MFISLPDLKSKLNIFKTISDVTTKKEPKRKGRIRKLTNMQGSEADICVPHQQFAISSITKFRQDYSCYVELKIVAKRHIKEGSNLHSLVLHIPVCTHDVLSMTTKFSVWKSFLCVIWYFFYTSV